MRPTENLLGLDDAFQRGNRLGRMNAAKRFGGSHAQKRSRPGGQIAIHNVHQAAKRFAVRGHADFVDDQRHHQGIDMIEQLQEDAASPGRAAAGKLAHHAVLRDARKILYAAGKKNFDRSWVDFA